MLLCPRPIEWGILHWWPSSVCSSVCLSRACQLSDPKSRMEGRSKLKIDRKEAHDTGDPWLHLEVERSRSPGRWTSWPKISRIFQTGRPTNFKLDIQNTDGVRWVASPTCAVTSMVKGHCFNVTSSVWRLFAHNSTKKCRKKKQNWQKDCLCHIPHQFQGQKDKVKSRSPGPLTLWPKISHIFGMERPASRHLPAPALACARPKATD